MISTEVYMDIAALKRQGHSLRWIAKKLGIGVYDCNGTTL